MVTMMSNIKKRPEINRVKMVQRFTHGNSNEIKRLFEESGMLTTRLNKAIYNVSAAFTPCRRSGPPKKASKISLKHVKNDFKFEVQVDFMTVKYQGTNYEILNVSDCSTAYRERSKVRSRCASQMMHKF